MRWFSAALQIGSCRLAAVLDHVIAHLLTIAQRSDAGALDRRDMDEDVLGAIIWLDEAVTLLGVEPFDCTSSHSFPLDRCTTFAPRRIHADDRRQTSKGMRPGRSSIRASDWANPKRADERSIWPPSDNFTIENNDRFASHCRLYAELDLHRSAESAAISLFLYFCVLPEKRRKWGDRFGGKKSCSCHGMIRFHRPVRRFQTHQRSRRVPLLKGQRLDTARIPGLNEYSFSADKLAIEIQFGRTLSCKL